MSTARRRLAVALLAGVVVSLPTACGAGPGNEDIPGPDTVRSGSPAPTSTHARPIDDQTRITVVGDSNSTGFSGTLEDGIAAGTAWAAHLPKDQFALEDGWAVDGATTTAMADAAASVAAGDVLVIMGGTNDLALGVPTETVLAELRRAADAVGAPVVAVAAIAPFDILPEEIAAFNSRLQRFAGDHGWLFIDPWRNVRAPDGTWAAAYRTDGIHTSAEGYAQAASEIARQLAAAPG